MKLSKAHLAIYIWLGTIAMLLGFIINQYQSCEAKLAQWKLVVNKCTYIVDKQEKIIEDAMSVFKR